MGRCQTCDQEVDLPFTCGYCHGKFCSKHRIPENHQCRDISAIVTSKTDARYDHQELGHVDSSFSTSSWGDNRNGAKSILKKTEVQHLIIAWLVLGFAFSVGNLFRPAAFPLHLTIALVTVGLGFIGHELSHKFIAQKFGLAAEFRLWTWGLIMALILAFASGGGFVFAAPGAVYIEPTGRAWSGGISRRENGYISLAGPAANIVIAMLFFLMRDIGGLLGQIGNPGYQINLVLAGFNLIPFAIMDGQKVFAWNKLVWVAITIPVWVLLALPYVLR